LEIKKPESNPKYSILEQVVSKEDLSDLQNTKKETKENLDHLKIFNEIRSKISKDFSKVE